MIHFGVVRPGSTLRIPFDSFAAATGAPSALSNFAVGDILIYKDGSTTERASTTGYTATTTFDSVTGLNEAVIDLSSDATGDFFKSGSNYTVAISPVTVDGQTMAFWAASFSIGYPDAVLNTSIATLSSQTSFTLTSGPAEDDALNGYWCLIHDKASAVQTTWAIVSDYTGSTKTVTLTTLPAATFTIAAIDNIHFFAPMPMQPTVSGLTLDVSAGGEAGVDWANVGGKTTANALTNTSIITTQKVDVDTIKTNPVVNAGTITFPNTATLASTTNISAATGIDVTKWNGTTVATPNTAGYPLVDVAKANGTNVGTTASGVLDVNVKNFNNVSASAVTTVKAVQGLAVDGQITTVTGNVNGSVASVTGLTASDVGSIKTKTDSLTFTVANKVDSNTYTWNGTAVSAPATAGIPEVNVKNIANAAVSTTSAQIGVNVVQISTDATAADNAESFFDGTGYAGTNNVIPLATTVTNLTNAPTAGDFTATMKTSIGTAVAASAVASVTAPVTIAASQLFVKKNTQLTSFMFKMVLTSDHVTAATGITVAVARAIDGGAFSASTNTPATEIANGWYKITLSAGDLNGTLIAFKATGTGCDQRDILIVTQA